MSKTIASILALAAFTLLAAAAENPASSEGVALAIVYDTSGSMYENVPDSSGAMTRKYLIANRALTAAIDHLQSVVRLAPPDAPLRIQTGLIVFRRDEPVEAVPFGKFNPDALRNWLKSFSRPDGATPLGDAVRKAGDTVLGSPLARKHVLVITDGANTRGPDPASQMPALLKKAAAQGAAVQFHFVAFDVDAGVFAKIKKLGATLVSASNEKQLNTQLDFILKQKILLEDEEPPAKPKS